jgi:hypothetical protein
MIAEVGEGGGSGEKVKRGHEDEIIEFRINNGTKHVFLL